MFKKNKKPILVTLLIILIIGAISILLIQQKQLVYEDPSQNVGYFSYELDPDEDTDGDGLINSEEEIYRTDINYVDTDGDGLSDYYEIMESMTDPLRPDSDYDGLDDNVELMAGLNPNKDKTLDMTHDYTRAYNVKKSDERIELSVSGNANIYDVYAGVFNTTGLKNTPGLVSEVYEFYLDASFKNAEVTFNYTQEEIDLLGIDENNLSIFCFTNDSEFEKVNSIIDTSNNTVTAKLKHFSRYVLGDKTVINTDLGSKVMLLIDNSGSMYSKEMIASSIESDLEFKRVDMANALIDYSGNSIEFGVAKFTATYTLISKIGSDVATSKEKINEIRTVEEVFDGTYIASSIKSALSEFKTNDYLNRKYIVLLTDGETTESWASYDEEDAIRDCINKHVTVIVIGLGNHTDVGYLQKIASGTGGIYLHASNANALESIYEKILDQMQYANVEIEHDGVIKKAISVADSGFDPANNGFSFENYCVLYDNEYSGGQCFGLASFAQKFYLSQIPTTGEPYKAKMGGVLNKDRYTTSAPAYDLTNTGVLDVTNLHDYENKWLDLYNDLYYKTPSKEKYTLEDSVLMFKDSYREKLNASGFKYFVTNMNKGQGKWGKEKYTSYESLAIDIDSYLESGEDDPDMNFITAIYWYYCLQSDGLSKDTRKTVQLGLLSDLSELIEYVSQGIPVVLSADGHCINVTGILRDAEDPKLYYIELYDNNLENSRYYYTVRLKKVGPIDGLSINKSYTGLKSYNCKVYNNSGNKVSVVFDVVY